MSAEPDPAHHKVLQALKCVLGPIKGSWQLRLKGRCFGSNLGIFLGFFFSLYSHRISLPKNTKTHQNFLILLSSPKIQARMHGTRARSPEHKQKGRGCEHMDISQVAMFSRFTGLDSSIWLYTLLNLLPSSLLSLLDGFYQVNHVIYHLSSSLEYGDSCLLSCSIFWAMLQGCRHLLSCSMCQHCA